MKLPFGEKLSLIMTCDSKDSDVALVNFPFRLIQDVLCFFSVEENLGQRSSLVSVLATTFPLLDLHIQLHGMKTFPSLGRGERTKGPVLR